LFLGRVVRAPQVRKVVESSRVKRAHLLHIIHRDQISSPVTDWMREAYQLQDHLPKLPNKIVKKKAAVKKTAKKTMKR
jgi:hypothetical protein